MMATSQSYHDYVLDQFRLAEGISTRKMMGEYVLYVQGRVMGGLYDDRLMVKPTAAARALLPDAPEEPPYLGAKPLLVAPPDDPELLAALAERMTPELEVPRKKKVRR